MNAAVVNHFIKPKAKTWKPWARDKCDELIRLYNTGYSAAEIAVKLGYTRNAVLGKLFRLKGSTAAGEAMLRKAVNPWNAKRIAK